MRTTFRLLQGTFKALYYNFDVFVRLCWAWFLILIALMSAVMAFIGSKGDPELTSAALIVVILFGLVANASIAVSWHRCLLLDETPGITHLKIGAREWAYLGRTVLVGVISFALMFAVGFTVHSFSAAARGAISDPMSFLAILTAAAVIFLIVPAVLRLSLILPAGAVDRPLGLGEAWRMSKSLGYPMLFALLGISIVIGLARELIDTLLNLVSFQWFLGVYFVLKSGILWVALQILSLALTIGILTGGYKIMLERLARD
ncbi:hypothetical protein HPQ64_04940 [Rhizobiales bacterium]|uniref:hypothetical protein n=1 Tax=Hongsoonwoonella zoysiae TaxID=2821844 RepID=UPI001561439D|nr:hypothetical protein [Hongsoonwoonella zoysiae]NRG17026.1 hypothetical protein [Hongsoonwoonella zoysiae]